MDMVTKKFIFCIGLLVILNTLCAQEEKTVTNETPRVIHFGDRLENDTFYTGIDGSFLISFANDSIIQARFFSEDMYDRYQKIRYFLQRKHYIIHLYSNYYLKIGIKSDMVLIILNLE